MVIEAGVVAGYVIAWAVRKARRVGGGVDAEIDTAIDMSLEKLHATVVAKLGAHPALEDLDEEAAAPAGQVSELTRQQVELAVTAAARKDDGFGGAVTELVAQIQAAERNSGISVAGPGARVFTGHAHAEASQGGVAFGQVGGDAHVYRDTAGEQASDPSWPGRSHR